MDCAGRTSGELRAAAQGDNWATRCYPLHTGIKSATNSKEWSVQASQERRKEGPEFKIRRSPPCAPAGQGKGSRTRTTTEDQDGWPDHHSSPENSRDSRRGGALTADQRSAAGCVIIACSAVGGLGRQRTGLAALRTYYGIGLLCITLLHRWPARLISAQSTKPPPTGEKKSSRVFSWNNTNEHVSQIQTCSRTCIKYLWLI